MVSYYALLTPSDMKTRKSCAVLTSRPGFCSFGSGVKWFVFISRFKLTSIFSKTFQIRKFTGVLGTVP